jgi:hypothetical protein
VGIGTRLIGVADLPVDDDDVRLRKRVGVTAGYITILAPWTLSLESPAGGIGLLLAIGLSLYSAVNLAIRPNDDVPAGRDASASFARCLPPESMSASDPGRGSGGHAVAGHDSLAVGRKGPVPDAGSADCFGKDFG